MKRITIFAGHYGSGKTNIAVNYAIELKKHLENVVIADLDIVNPYFRTKDSEEKLASLGIKLISSPFANSNVDTPALSPETYSIIDDKSIYGIIDVGGDDRGALALGRYSSAIAKEDDYEMLFVINAFRPLTRTPEDAVEVMREIEDAAKIKFTGIVNNSNLGDETTPEMVLESMDYAEKVSGLTGLKIYMTTAKTDVAEKLGNKIQNIMPLKLYVRQTWNKEE